MPALLLLSAPRAGVRGAKGGENRRVILNEQRRKVDGLARTLAEIREELAGLESIRKHTREVLDRSRIAVQYAASALVVKNAKSIEAAAKSDLSDALVDLYRDIPEDGTVEKHPATHQIRRPVEVVYSASDARKYCMEKHPEFLVLDTGAFERFAKSSGAKLDFVVLGKGLSVTIKGDLSGFLG